MSRADPNQRVDVCDCGFRGLFPGGLMSGHKSAQQKGVLLNGIGAQLQSSHASARTHLMMTYVNSF